MIKHNNWRVSYKPWLSCLTLMYTFPPYLNSSFSVSPHKVLARSPFAQNSRASYCFVTIYPENEQQREYKTFVNGFTSLLDQIDLKYQNILRVFLNINPTFETLIRSLILCRPRTSRWIGSFPFVDMGKAKRNSINSRNSRKEAECLIYNKLNWV